MNLSKNEWGDLKSVIVGTAEHARIPEIDISLRTINYADTKDVSTIPHGLYPKQVIEEASEDLEIFVDFLKGEHIEVLRPDRSIIPNYYNYCPRDSVLVYDNLILAAPQPIRARKNEYLAMDDIFKNFVPGVRYIVPDIERGNSLYNISCINNPNILALTEAEPAFDAANILRDNDNLYYLVSNSGNKKGAELLQELVGNTKKVWPIEGVYSFMHIDSTIALLREGLMLLNPSRIKSIEQLPLPLRSWEVIWAPDPVDIGHYPGYCNASIWMNMNLFSVNPNLVALEEHQHSLRKILKSYKIDCAMLPMRHERTLGGGFHCVTLDLERK
jgi:glycine amidinotransferase